MKKKTTTKQGKEFCGTIQQRPIGGASEWQEVSEASDDLLIERSLQGDALAFHALVERYRTRVAAISFQVLGNYEDARDVTQDVFVKLFRSLHTFDTDKKFFTWLYRMTTNASIDYLRSRRKRSLENSIEEQPEYYQETIPHPDGDGFARIESNEINGFIRTLADRLNSNQRRAFVLCDLEGMSSVETCKIMSCQKVTLRWYLHQARKNIRGEVVKHYPEYAIA